MSKNEAPAVEPGVLYIVATPIGNLGDLSPRALLVLREVDVLAAEDTRVLHKLASAFGVPAGARLTSLHEHNERSRAGWIVQQLQAGRSVGLFSDAGTPMVSDPGYPVARAAIEAGLPVVPIPGPSALLAALVGSGLPPDELRFCGFLNRSTGKRRRSLEALSQETATLVFYEAQQRVLDALGDLHAVLGNRSACACRDLTKRGERFVRGRLSEIAATLCAEAPLQGEWVLVVGGAEPVERTGVPAEADRLIAALLRRELGAREVRDLVVEVFELPKSEVYARVLALSKGD